MIGKTDKAAYLQAVDDYARRLNHYLPFDTITLPDLKQTRNLSEAQQKEKEGELILKALLPGDYCVLLDERGHTYTSEGFATYLENKMHTVSKRLVFIIGGPYGFSPDVYKAASDTLSLSPMTFSHQMIRLLFTEQLYRAMTILRNEPYHHA
jgi:23S rRNA (pseudouridine1915-N3)-methyltransferase